MVGGEDLLCGGLQHRRNLHWVLQPYFQPGPQPSLVLNVARYCNDGNWPPKKTCGADTFQCNTQCAQCVPDNKDKATVCINNGITTQSACSAAVGYKWDWDGQV